MRTIDFIVGKKYIIYGNECNVTYNGIGFKAIVLSGKEKGKEISGIHGNIEATEL